MGRNERSPEEQAWRAKIRELLQLSSISSMEDIQDLFKETIWDKNYPKISISWKDSWPKMTACALLPILLHYLHHFVRLHKI